jgi:uncharacterized protein involved in outer membrane biogenesis
LLRGEFEIVQLTWHGLDLLLEINAQGQKNWQFGAGGNDQDTASTALPEALVVHALQLENAQLRFHDERTKRQFDVSIKTARIQRLEGERPVSIEAQVALNGQLLDLTAKTSAPGRRPFDFAANVQSGGLAGAIQGRLIRPANARLNFKATVSDTAALSTLLIFPLDPALAPLELSGEINADSGLLHFSGLRLVHANGVLNGDLELFISGEGDERPRVTGSIVSAALDLRTVLAGAEKSPPQRANRIFSTTPWPTIPPSPVDVAVQIYADAVQLPTTRVTNLKAHIRIDRDRLSADPLSLQAFGASATGHIQISPGPEDIEISGALAAKALDLEAAQAATGLPSTLAGHADIRTTFAGRGNSAAHFASNLDGRLLVKLDEAKADLGGLDRLVGGLAGLFTRKGDDGRWSEFNCGALDIQFDDGRGDTRLLIDTNQAVVTGKGIVDIGTEGIDLLLRPEPKSVTLNISVPVEVKGPLTNPSLTPQAGATLVRLGGLLGTVLFPPAALLAFGDVGSGNDPCLSEAARTASKAAADETAETATRAVANTAAHAGAAASSGAKAAGKAVGKAVEGVMDGIGKGLKSLFGN